MAAVTEGCYIFALMFCFELTAFGNARSNERKPFGPKMCEEFCCQVNSCSPYLFIASSLTCHLLRVTDKVQKNEGEFLFHNRKGEDKKCPRCSRFPDRKSLVRKCPQLHVRKSMKVLASVDRRNEGDNSRYLLVAQNNERSAPLQKILLSNNRVEEYPFIRLNFLQAIAFSSKTQEVFVSQRQPALILSFPLASSKEKLLCRGSAKSLSIDENEKLVFWVGNPGINRMKTDGKDIKMIMKSPNYRSLSVDGRHKTIYVSSISWVFSCDYNGSIIDTKVTKRRDSKAIYFDTIEQALYFTERVSVFRLFNKTTTKFVSFKAPPETLVYFDGIMYATLMNNNAVAKFNSSVMDLQTNFKGKGRLMMCVVQ